MLGRPARPEEKVVSIVIIISRSNISSPVGLIGSFFVPNIVQWHPVMWRLKTWSRLEVHRPVATTALRTIYTFIVCSFPRSPITVLDPVASSTAAAAAKQPENARCEREQNGQPNHDVHVVAQRTVNVVFL